MSKNNSGLSSITVVVSLTDIKMDYGYIETEIVTKSSKFHSPFCGLLHFFIRSSKF